MRGDVDEPGGDEPRDPLVGDRGSSDGSAGAWAAAAVVLAVGALGFGVFAQLRASDLAARVERLETARAASPLSDATTNKVNTTLKAIPPTAGLPVVPSQTTVLPTTAPASQPPDVIGAENAVRQAYAIAYDGTQALDARLSVIDDSRGVDAAFRAAGTGQYATSLANARGTVSRVSFTSDNAATVSYSVFFNGQSGAERQGTAVAIEGVWRITRATVCADLAAVNAPCGQ